jgi:hypothetical protein
MTFFQKIAVILALAPCQPLHAGIDLAFPTANTTLIENHPETFYQHVERDFEGVRSTPWEGGQFGFVRDPVRSGAEVVFRKFHEGIDIRPLTFSPGGEPLDDVRPIARGVVAYSNPHPGASNYGRYVVVRHRWDGSDYFSLYAHLAEIAVAPGDTVACGTRLGRIGYSGSGIDKSRAHLHLEIAILLNLGFQNWYDLNFKTDPNKNGIFNGINLAGLDPARLLIESSKNPSLSIPEFVRKDKTAFKVAVPVLPAIARRYPWMLSGHSPDAAGPAWEIAFNRHGFPLGIAPFSEPVATPRVSFVAPTPHRLTWITRNWVGGSFSKPVLTPSGERFLSLLLAPEP